MLELAPELRHLQRLQQVDSPYVSSHRLTTVSYRQQSYGVDALRIGGANDNVPALLFTGGVHGVERIGAQVVLAFLDNVLQRLQWDDSIHDLLQSVTLWFVPVVNPVGLAWCRRSNGQCVDLMRNAPISADGPVTPLVGGQRLTRWLPWYRGDAARMEDESKALMDLVLQLAEQSSMLLTLDVHSGFGMHDRLWFPLACSRRPIAHLPEMFSLQRLLRSNYPNHDYLFEPQSQHYLTHGDLWDYAYLEAQRCDNLLLPLTLEMGSWRWVKKNPRQLGRLGMFNPVKPHRLQRVLRRHLVLMEFLIRATRSWLNWVPAADQRLYCQQQAMQLWYDDNG